MASSVLDILLRTLKSGMGVTEVKRELTDLERETGNAEKTTKGFNIAQMAMSATAVTAVRTIARETLEMFELGAGSTRATTALQAFAGGSAEAEQALDGVLRASDGAISRMSAAANAARLFSMGLASNAQEAEQLTKIAITLGTAMGRGPQEAFEEFTLLLANQSIQRLDTFGISAGRVRTRIEELQKQVVGLSREEAFKMATIEIATQRLEALEEQGYQAATAIDQMKAAFENVKVALAERIFNLGKDADAGGIVEFTNAFAELNQMVDAGSISQGKFTMMLWKAALSGANLSGELGKINWEMALQQAAAQSSDEVWDEIAATWEEASDAGEGLAQTTLDTDAAMKALQQTMSLGLTEGFEKAREKVTELKDEEAELVAKIAELEGKSYLNSRQKDELENLNGQLGGVREEIDNVTAAWDLQTKQMIFNLAQQQLAVDGFTEEEMMALAKLAGPEGFGLVDEAGVKMIEGVARSGEVLAEAGDQSDYYTQMLKQQQGAINDLNLEQEEMEDALERSGASMEEWSAILALPRDQIWSIVSGLHGLVGTYIAEVWINVHGRVPFVARQGITAEPPGEDDPYAMAEGGSFIVGGAPGRDRVPVNLMLQQGERVTVENREQQYNAGSAGGEQAVVVNVFLDGQLIQRQLARGLAMQGVSG